MIFFATMFGFSVYWYLEDDGRTEAIIVGLGFLSVLITGIFFRQQKVQLMKEKNVLIETEVEADNAHIGDKKVQKEESYDRKNIVTKSKIKVRNNFRLGDDG